jgi:hypothetical protein
MTRTRVLAEHPGHRNTPGAPEPIVPAYPTGWSGFKARRACRKAGGHYWHPSDGMIGWGCCNCGARTDGMPWDGR